MTELIKRIDAELPYADEVSGILASLLRDCRAEIVNLKEVNANLSNLTLEYELEIERLSKPYVPMTDDEWHEISAKWQEDTAKCMNKKNPKLPPFHLYIETAVIKRLGLEIKHD